MPATGRLEPALRSYGVLIRNRAWPTVTIWPSWTMIAVTVPSYTEACGLSGTCIPQSGGGKLDSLSDRLMYRAAYRNFGGY